MALVPCEIRLKRGEVSPRKAGGCWGQDDEGGEHGEAEDVKVAQACPTLGIFPTPINNLLPMEEVTTRELSLEVKPVIHPAQFPAS